MTPNLTRETHLSLGGMNLDFHQQGKGYYKIFSEALSEMGKMVFHCCFNLYRYFGGGVRV